MATTVTPSNLTVTISSTITLGKQELSSTNQIIIPNIALYDKRIVNVLTTPQANIIQFSSGSSAGTFVTSNVKYIQITNLDNSNWCRIRVTKASAETFDIKLDPGQSFIMCNAKESAVANGASFSAFVDATAIAAQADTGAVDLQVIVASISL
mgnify:CR=1 FL=1